MADAPTLMADVFRFLGVDDSFVPDLSHRSLARRAPRFATAHYFLKKLAIWYPLRALVPSRLRGAARRAAFSGAPAMRADDRRYLVDYYRDDIGALAKLLHRDLEHWLRI